MSNFDFDFDIPTNQGGGNVPPRRPLPKKNTETFNQEPQGFPNTNEDTESQENNEPINSWEINEGGNGNNNHSPEDIFSDFGDSNNQGNWNKGKKENNNNNSNANNNFQGNQGGQDERYSTPQVGVNKNLLTVAGVIGLIVIISLGLKIGTAKFKDYRQNRENRIRLYNSQVTQSADVFVYTEGDSSTVSGKKGDLTSPKINKKGNNNTMVISDIAKFTKFVSEDNRTGLNLILDEYGEYNIFIPHMIYETLESKGYLIVDLEIVDKKITYIYISEKQENFEKILDN